MIGYNIGNKYNDLLPRDMYLQSALQRSKWRGRHYWPYKVIGRIYVHVKAPCVILHFKSCSRLFNGSCPDPTANSMDVMNPVNLPHLAFKYRCTIDSTCYPRFHDMKHGFSLLWVFLCRSIEKARWQ